MSRRPLEIVIESLVLDGFDPASREAIAAATVAALGTLLRNQQLAPRAAATPHLVAPPIQLASLDNPRAIGEGIARAVHAALPNAWPGARG